MQYPESMTLVELTQHPDKTVREVAYALLSILKDKTPVRKSSPLRESTLTPQ